MKNHCLRAMFTWLWAWPAICCCDTWDTIGTLGIPLGHLADQHRNWWYQSDTRDTRGQFWPQWSYVCGITLVLLTEWYTGQPKTVALEDVSNFVWSNKNAAICTFEQYCTMYTVPVDTMIPFSTPMYTVGDPPWPCVQCTAMYTVGEPPPMTIAALR